MAEASIFARAYCPSRLDEMMPKWAASLKEQNFPFQPDSVTQAQGSDMQAEMEREKQMREQLYDQPKQPAS